MCDDDDDLKHRDQHAQRETSCEKRERSELTFFVCHLGPLPWLIPRSMLLDIGDVERAKSKVETFEGCSEETEIEAEVEVSLENDHENGSQDSSL